MTKMKTITQKAYFYMIAFCRCSKKDIPMFKRNDNPQTNSVIISDDIIKDNAKLRSTVMGVAESFLCKDLEVSILPLFDLRSNQFILFWIKQWTLT